MSFDYQKSRGHGGNDSFWTSYSDLFLGLSAIFLMLYVTASLRTSTDAINAEVQNRKLTMRVQDLENQLKMYDSIRKDYLESSAPPSEAKEYRELMDKLTLLKEEARDEKDKLQKAALDNDAKETALNKYQQMIRNVINANKLAKTKLTNREEIIDEQHEEIGTQNKQVVQLKQQITKRQNLLAEGERKVKSAEQALQTKIAELKKSHSQNQISSKIYQKRMAKVREESMEKIEQLLDSNEHYAKNLNEAKSKLGNLSGQLEKTQGEAAGLRGELVKAKAEGEARRAIAKEIKAGFAANGVKADINMETGDVVIDFGDHYFAMDSAGLKVEMKQILNKAMPTYTKSLFGNAKVAKQISAVEVIGFASPIYRGKYVDPHSNKPEDRQALKYNMDLSYRRAKSIFTYILDGKEMKFPHQEELVPLMKVSGRSFLEVYKDTRKLASGEDFCKLHDCNQSQRVIIRFNIERGK